MNIKEAYKVMQAAWVDLYDVKVGDTVRMLRVAKSEELGWDTCWVSPMNCRVGQSGVVKTILETDIGVEFEDDWHNFPFFCLEKIKSALHTIAFDGGEPEEVCDKCYEALKKALLKQQQARTRD